MLLRHETAEAHRNSFDAIALNLSQGLLTAPRATSLQRMSEL